MGMGLDCFIGISHGYGLVTGNNGVGIGLARGT
jgi:hypothetical protein